MSVGKVKPTDRYFTQLPAIIYITAISTAFTLLDEQYGIIFVLRNWFLVKSPEILPPKYHGSSGVSRKFLIFAALRLDFVCGEISEENLWNQGTPTKPFNEQTELL